MVVDFEQGAYLAALLVFPNITVYGCYYHLSGSVKRRVSQIGLSGKYSSDRDCRIRVRCLSAMAFAPESDAPALFQQLVDLFEPEEAELVAYFFTTYIGNDFITPMFPISLWTVFPRIAAGILRTNNCVEGFHNGFSNYIINGRHPSMWDYIKGLHRQQSISKKMMAEIAAGVVRKQKPYQEERNRRLTTLVNNYINDHDSRKPLSGVSYNYMTE